MKVFHFNDDWFASDAIGRVNKHDRKTADKPFCIIVTYKYTRIEIIYDYKTETERDNNFATLISNWRHACGD
jgi:hypothetical protein